MIQITEARHNLIQTNGSGRGAKAVLHLDYFSCFLTVVSTVLVGRKHWMGLVIASVNSVIVCVIGMRTGQYGFVPANLFCILTYAWCVGTWRRDSKPELVRATPAAPIAPKFLQTNARAIAPTRKVHTGLYLAYNAKSISRMGSGAKNSPANSTPAVVLNAGS